jgi:hypothetical protein
MDMERAKTLVSTHGGVSEMDTVRLGDAWWLVCSWSDTQQTRPKRVIRLSGLQHEEVKGQPYRFVLSRPLPTQVLEAIAVAGFHVEDLA